MKNKCQTRKEAFDPTGPLPSPRHLLRIGNWNTQTMYQTGKTAQVLKEMQRYRLNILGVSEVRWTGADKISFATGEVMYYSGRDDEQHREGVGLILDKEAKKSIMEWEPVCSRIIRARFYSRITKMTIIQCYAPTEDADIEVKDEFYAKLQEQLSKVSNRDILIVMGDLNAKVGQDNTGVERNMGKHGLGSRNDNGERFLDFCMENELVIGGTLFQHKRIHKETWLSPDNKTRNQIDHVAISQRWRTSLQDVKAIRGADIDSDHQLVLCKVRLKLRKVVRRNRERLFNSHRLKDPATQQAFSIELSDRYHFLNDIPIDDLDEYCAKIQETFLETSRSTLGYQENYRKPWISDNTWSLIEQRRSLREEILNRREEGSDLVKNRYKEKSKEVKISAKRDKKRFLENKAQEAEDAARKGDTRTLYRITRELTGTRSRACPLVRDKDGKILTQEDEQRARWAEHFKTVLNQPDPESPADIIQTTTREFEMKTKPISCTEIEEAILETKGNRATGEDKISADMLKADPTMSAKCLVELFNKVWVEEEVPEAWKKGIIVKLPKKGDMKDCGNWRGINLLSVPGKIFCRVLLRRMKTSLEKILREEQAGFRSGRSCIDQIFVLRTIIEQSIEWNSSLYLNFIDFAKAFDSVHHSTLWKILESYGFPKKVINILKSMYEGNQCSEHGGQQSEWFQIKSGVRQGCVISPLLFLVAIDWVMKTATSDKPRGIVWNSFERLEDEDFADDIALVSHSYADIQEKTNRIEQTAKSVGLRVNLAKTKTMRINAKTTMEINLNGQNLENVNKFKYLGSYLTADSNIEKEIQTRIALASAAFQRMRPI